ncbi:putative mediator of RNA polymerase II transcription subunit 26 isoform X1 [Parasteatoda tepidariorum]|uniref:putative mediator of RNA polymerase II transcription subunit 26 isoform X1 n=1 Tax=Parasteatoda tepidariorum TaxID=114398 RepID=UPI001C71A303|nr:uncharacterized threonine-rich GPI-anchored glycoprotein PJ4664.02 isoform X1 [Parasteatoda tepidariorum]
MSASQNNANNCTTSELNGSASTNQLVQSPFVLQQFNLQQNSQILDFNQSQQQQSGKEQCEVQKDPNMQQSQVTQQSNIGQSEAPQQSDIEQSKVPQQSNIAHSQLPQFNMAQLQVPEQSNMNQSQSNSEQTKVPQQSNAEQSMMQQSCMQQLQLQSYMQPQLQLQLKQQSQMLQPQLPQQAQLQTQLLLQTSQQLSQILQQSQQQSQANLNQQSQLNNQPHFIQLMQSPQQQPQLNQYVQMLPQSGISQTLVQQQQRKDNCAPSYVIGNMNNQVNVPVNSLQSQPMNALSNMNQNSLFYVQTVPQQMVTQFSNNFGTQVIQSNNNNMQIESKPALQNVINSSVPSQISNFQQIVQPQISQGSTSSCTTMVQPHVSQAVSQSFSSPTHTNMSSFSQMPFQQVQQNQLTCSPQFRPILPSGPIPAATQMFNKGNVLNANQIVGTSAFGAAQQSYLNCLQSHTGPVFVIMNNQPQVSTQVPFRYQKSTKFVAGNRPPMDNEYQGMNVKRRKISRMLPKITNQLVARKEVQAFPNKQPVAPKIPNLEPDTTHLDAQVKINVPEFKPVTVSMNLSESTSLTPQTKLTTQTDILSHKVNDTMLLNDWKSVTCSVQSVVSSSPAVQPLNVYVNTTGFSASLTGPEMSSASTVLSNTPAKLSSATSVISSIPSVLPSTISASFQNMSLVPSSMPPVSLNIQSVSSNVPSVSLSIPSVSSSMPSVSLSIPSVSSSMPSVSLSIPSVSSSMPSDESKSEIVSLSMPFLSSSTPPVSLSTSSVSSSTSSILTSTPFFPLSPVTTSELSLLPNVSSQLSKSPPVLPKLSPSLSNSPVSLQKTPPLPKLLPENSQIPLSSSTSTTKSSSISSSTSPLPTVTPSSSNTEPVLQRMLSPIEDATKLPDVSSAVSNTPQKSLVPTLKSGCELYESKSGVSEPLNEIVTPKKSEPFMLGAKVDHLESYKPIKVSPPTLINEKEIQTAVVRPSILTHYIDGFMIQEANEPFPVSSPYQNCTTCTSSRIQKFIEKLSTDSLSKRAADSLSKPVTDSFSKSVTDFLSKPVTDSLSKPVTDPLSKRLADSIPKLSTETLSNPSTDSVLNSSTEPLSKPHEDPLSEPQTEPLLSKPKTESLSKPQTELLPQPQTELLSKPHTKSLTNLSSVSHTEPLPQYLSRLRRKSLSRTPLASPKASTPDEKGEVLIKRGRGRPRKKSLPEKCISKSLEESTAEIEIMSEPEKKESVIILDDKKEENLDPPNLIPIHLLDPSVSLSKWSVDDVYTFVKSIPICANDADLLKENEVDGAALSLLKMEHLIDSMGFTMGRALKLMAEVDKIKRLCAS